MNDRREDRAVIPAITTALLAALYLVMSGSPAQAQATGVDLLEGTYRFEVLSPDGEADHDGRGPLEWVVVSAERIGPASLEACERFLLAGRVWPR